MKGSGPGGGGEEGKGRLSHTVCLLVYLFPSCGEMEEMPHKKVEHDKRARIRKQGREGEKKKWKRG